MERFPDKGECICRSRLWICQGSTVPHYYDRGHATTRKQRYSSYQDKNAEQIDEELILPLQVYQGNIVDPFAAVCGGTVSREEQKQGRTRDWIYYGLSGQGRPGRMAVLSGERLTRRDGGAG